MIRPGAFVGMPKTALNGRYCLLLCSVRLLLEYLMQFTLLAQIDLKVVGCCMSALCVRNIYAK